MVITVGVLNYKKTKKLLIYLFRSGEIRDLEPSVSIPLEETATILFLSDKQQKQLIYSTLWLFIAFVTLFLTFGIQYLSKEYYAVIPTNNTSNHALILLLIIIAGLITFRDYISFNIKKFILGD